MGSHTLSQSRRGPTCPVIAGSLNTLDQTIDRRTPEVILACETPLVINYVGVERDDRASIAVPTGRLSLL